MAKKKTTADPFQAILDRKAQQKSEERKARQPAIEQEDRAYRLLLLFGAAENSLAGQQVDLDAATKAVHSLGVALRESGHAAALEKLSRAKGKPASFEYVVRMLLKVVVDDISTAQLRPIVARVEAWHQQTGDYPDFYEQLNQIEDALLRECHQKQPALQLVRANNSRLFPEGEFEDEDLMEFVQHLDRMRDGKKSDAQIARDYKKNSANPVKEGARILAKYRMRRKRGFIGI